MTRCLNCGTERTAEPCDFCGLSSDTAEVMFRRRLLYLTAVYLLGAIAFFPASQMYPPLELDAILIFVGLMFFLTLGLAVWLERRARRHLEVEPLKRIFHGLIPVPWLLAGLLLLNGRFDTAPVVRHVTRVDAKFSMPGLVPSTRLVVTSWRPDRRVERVPVSRDDYERFARSDTVEVRVGEGLVGIPWVPAVHRK